MKTTKVALRADTDRGRNGAVFALGDGLTRAAMLHGELLRGSRIRQCETGEQSVERGAL